MGLSGKYAWFFAVAMFVVKISYLVMVVYACVWHVFVI